MVKFLTLISSIFLVGLTNGFSLPDSLLKRIERVANKVADKKSHYDQTYGDVASYTSELFSLDLERSILGVEDDMMDSAEKRWTDLGRPWTRSYSKFRRVLKKLLQAKDAETAIESAGQLRSYGCWCMPRGDRDFSNGRGAARDTVDHDCKGVGQCKTCIAMKTPECNTVDTNYHFDIVEFENTNGQKQLDMVCKDDEGGCQWSICQCDREFAKSLTNKLIAGAWNSTMNQKSKWASEEKFDFENTCNIRKRADIIHTPYECCGTIPNWRPFDTQSGQMKCCGKRVYDKDRATCSADGNLVAT